MKDKILSLMREIANEGGVELSATIGEDTVLLESGLDSLGFAILIARLEEDLGYDPFTMMDEPVYPQTFGELIGIYQRFKP
ncbi:acyl carrier protein [Massilia solisilvae]|uniref:Acyl carrier protein n=1 Tax=Massilia solisilvae TaxID=1811225 RepID=A0ABT2BEP1_9BURK|nr:acyl carrier protein [Massilia solisilvae]MCS0606984.1 acyl carrier protein [Massilia solisilvae]